MRLQRRILYFLLVITLFVVSCDITTLIKPAAIPTTVQGGVETIVAQTAAVAASRTAALFTATLTPSFTPFPTNIPSTTPTNTPTFIFFLVSPTSIPGLVITPVTPVTPSSTIDYQCEVTGQSPADGATEASNQNFVAIWTVTNTGRKTWDSTSVDFIYSSGTKFGKSKGADLPNSVGSGQAVSLKITMTAPKNSGSYKTVWALRRGLNEFCSMSLRIVVP